MPKFLKIRSLAAVLPLFVAAACAEAVKPVNGNNDDLFAPVNGGSGGGAGSGDAGSAGTGGAGASGESGAAGTSGSSGQSGSAAGNAGTAGSAGTSAGSAGAGATAGNAGAGSAGKAGAGGSAGAGATGGAGGADSPFGGGGTSGKAGSGAKGGAGGNPNPFGGGGTSSGTCDHSPCDIGIPLDPTCDSCASIVCGDDPFCCEVDWDEFCASNAVDLCNNCSGSGGSGGGPAACAHDPCTSGPALKKGCDPCVTAVCASDSFCCNTAWDSICVGKAQSTCGTTCP